MRRPLLLLLLASAASAAPVPKVEPDKLPEGAILRLGTQRFHGPHTGRVTFSKDGKTLVGIDDAGTVVRWDAETGRVVGRTTFEVKDVVSAWVVGERAIFACNPKPSELKSKTTFRVFDADAGKERCSFTAVITVNATYVGKRLAASEYLYRIVTASFSADGKRFAAWGVDEPPVVFDTDTGEQVGPLASGAPPGWPHLVPDGTRLLVITGSNHGSNTRVFDLASGKETAAITDVIGPTFSPDGKRAAGAWREGEGQRVKHTFGVRDLATDKPQPAPDLRGQLWDSVFLTADVLVVCHEADRGGAMLTAWDVKAGKAVWKTGAFALVRGGEHFGERVGVGPQVQHQFWLATSPDGKRVVASNGKDRVAVFDAGTGERVGEDPSHPEPVRWARVSADGKTVFTAGDREVREWDAATGVLRSVGGPEKADASFRFAGATDEQVVWVSREVGFTRCRLAACDLKTGKEAWRVEPDIKHVWQVEAAGKQVVVTGGKVGNGAADTLAVYGQRGKEVRSLAVSSALPGHSSLMAVTSDRLFTNGVRRSDGGEQRFGVWSLETGKGVADCKLAAGEVFDGQYTDLQPTADGKTAALVTTNGEWAVVEVDGGKVIQKGKTGLPFCGAVGWSADAGRLFAYGVTAEVRVCEPKKDGKMWTLDGKGAATSAAAFSPDGKKAVVGYRDGTALVWDVSK